MNHRFAGIFITLAVLTACAPAPTATHTAAPVIPTPQIIEVTPTPWVVTATPESSETPTLTETPTSAPTETPLPQATLKQDATLYSGPGNVGYDMLGKLKAGLSVAVVGTFVDFAKIQAASGGNETDGFILKSALDSIPETSRELSIWEVPWQPAPVLNSFVSEHTIFSGDQIRLQNTTNGYWDVEGTAISLSGPVQVTGNLQEDTSGYGAIKILGIPERQSQDWWRGMTRMFVWLDHGDYQLAFWDGRTESPRITFPLPLRAGRSWSVVFKEPQGKTLDVLDDAGRVVKTVDVTRLPGLNLPNGLFPQSKLYLGASSHPNSTLTLSSVSLRFPPLGKQTAVAVAPVGLRALAAPKGISMGTEFEMWRMSDPRYWNIMSRDFDLAFLESFSSCNKKFWLGRGDYDFSTLDPTVNFLISHGWRVRAANLVWGATQPAVCIPPDSISKGGFSRDQYIQILQEYVETVVSHFKGRVAEWTLANEAIGRSFCGHGCDYWMDWIGPDYIEIAFRAAREADPNATLILNEVNNESPRDSNTQAVIDKMYDTVKTLKGKGVPIDGVGMQMHLLLPGLSQIPPNKNDVIKTMQRFASLGVSIYVTEFDVNLTNVPGSQQDKWNYEANLYHEMMSACIESGACKGFSTWGIGDSTSWITCADTLNGCVNLPDADPLMFDKNFQPKPAYFGVQNALLGK